jgi:hypothetical protein
MQKEQRVKEDTELTAEALKDLVQRYKRVYADHKKTFPINPCDQLRATIVAVFLSWQSERAIVYRKLNLITGLAGTAVNVQVCSQNLNTSPASLRMSVPGKCCFFRPAAARLCTASAMSSPSLPTPSSAPAQAKQQVRAYPMLLPLCTVACFGHR